MNGAHRFPSAVSLILPVTAEGRQEDMEKRPGRLEQVHRFLFSVPYYAVSLLLWPVLWGGWGPPVGIRGRLKHRQSRWTTDRRNNPMRGEDFHDYLVREC